MKPTLFNLEIQTKEIDGQAVAEVDIDGIIGFDWWADEEEQNTKQKMREQLRQIDAIEADKIIVNISSLGGDVDHGLAIHDLLASNPATVETHVIGMTASAATIIAQAGDERFMSDNALYLVHRAWTIGMGNANDFEALAEDLKKLDGRISNIYAKRSDKEQQAFMDLMNKSNGDGVWITAGEALDYGLIDTVSEPMKAAAMPKDVFDKFNIPTPPQADTQKNIQDKEFITYKLNIDLHVNGEPFDGTIEDLKALSGLPEEIEEESTDVESVSATSRERAKLKQKNLKYQLL